MKALVYTGTMQSEIRDVAAPQAGEGEALVGLAFCGLCGSDMHAWHGHDGRRIPPLVLGHEAVGMALNGHHQGKRVAINPLMSCKTCDFCRNGNEHLCQSRELIGMRVPGAFAEQVVIDESNLYLLGDDIPYHVAALAEPLACAVHAVRLGDIADTGREVIILGGGAIGLLAAFVYRYYGFENVRIAETNAFRRAMLNDLDGIVAFDPIDAFPQGPDIIFDAVGTGTTRKVASVQVKPGGEIIHIGLQDSLDGLDTRRLTLQEISFHGSYCYRNRDFAEALAILEEGAISPEGWTEIRPLDDGVDAFLAVHEGRAPPKIILETR